MTNHYTILGVPNYSSWVVVRKAYILLIKKYHPDINKTQEAILICQQLNVAKEALESADKKTTYDARLKRYIANPVSRYSPPVRPQPRTSRQMTRQERIKRNMARNKANYMKEYEKWLDVFPMPVRYTLFGILGGSFLLIFYIVFLRGAVGQWVAMSMVVLGIYYYIVMWATSDHYKYNYYKNQKMNANIDLDKASSKFLNYGFFGGCSVVVILKILATYL